MSRASEIGVVAGGLEPLGAVAPGLVRIRAVDNAGLGLVAELEDRPVPSGYGVWSQIERPKKLPITDYAGLEPLAIPIPMLLDRWPEQRSVEPEIKMLETIAGRHGAERASVVTIEGPGIPFSFERDSSLRFVLSDLSFGEDQRTFGAAGERCFSTLSVTAVEYTAPDLIITKDPKAPRRYYKVTKKPPNTIAGIAKKYRTTSKKILSLNKGVKGIPRDKNVKIKAGKKVRVS
jgi:hypothetical protein